MTILRLEKDETARRPPLEQRDNVSWVLLLRRYSYSAPGKSKAQPCKDKQATQTQHSQQDIHIVDGAHSTLK